VWSSRGWGRPRIGRVEVWDALLLRRQRVVDGAGGLTLLEGDGGVGKSTFLSLVVEDATAAGFRVVSAKASWIEDPPPFRMIGDALKALGAAVVPAASRRVPVPSSGPLGFLPAMSEGGSRYSTADSLDATTDNAHSELASSQLRFLGSLAEPLLAASQSSPVLMALDDLHWSDEASRGFLLYLLPRIRTRPIWVVASCTSADARLRGRPDPLTSLRARPEVDSVSLRPLSPAEVQEFVEWVLPQKAFAEEELHHLHNESEGVPSRVIQLLFPSAARTTPSRGVDLLPDDDERRMADLDPQARRLLNLTLVAGPEFSLQELAEAAGLDEERAVEFLEQFVRLGLMHELEDGRFAFDRDETRDRLYARLPPRLLRGYHQRLAESLIRSGSSDIKTVYALARHTYLAGMMTAAVEYNRRAAAYASERFQPGVSLLYLRLALEALSHLSPTDAQTEIEVRLEIAGQQVRLGEADAAERTLEEIRASRTLWSSMRPGERALLGVYLARVMADQGRWEQAEKALNEIPVDPLGAAPGELRRSQQRLRGEILFYRADYIAALEAYEASLLIARVEGNGREIAADAIRHATALSMIPGREAEAIEEFRSAVDRLVEIGDRAEAAFGTLCLGAQLTVMNRADEARIELQRSVEMSEAAHDVRRSGWARLNLAELEFGLGRLEAASEEARQARVCFERVEDALGIARSALTEGRLALARGDLGAAQRSLDTARTIFRAHDLKADEMEVELRWAELELARHDELGARQRLVRAIEGGLVRLRPDLLEDGQRLGKRLRPPILVRTA
jgi:tetratricopeptide (TPR) repeat protein